MTFARMLLTGIALLTALAGRVDADATIPTRDIAAAKDSPILKRYEGSFIVSYERDAFDELRIPLSPLERHNSRKHMPRREKIVEGTRTRLVYLLPPHRSPLEVLGNYEDEVKAAGGSILFSCKDGDCGGDPRRSTYGGGGHTSLLMYFISYDQIKDAVASTGRCALTMHIEGQRFSAARIPHEGGEAHVTIHTYKLLRDLRKRGNSDRQPAATQVPAAGRGFRLTSATRRL